jgi:hypothetical protein
MFDYATYFEYKYQRNSELLVNLVQNDNCFCVRLAISIAAADDISFEETNL